MIACYIIFSPSKKSFYTGFVQNSFEERLDKHNSGSDEKTYTNFANDWELFVLIECSSVHQALCIEKHIKRMKSNVYITNLKRYPEMIEKLKIKYDT